MIWLNPYHGIPRIPSVISLVPKILPVTQKWMDRPTLEPKDWHYIMSGVYQCPEMGAHGVDPASQGSNAARAVEGSDIHEDSTNLLHVLLKPVSKR